MGRFRVRYLSLNSVPLVSHLGALPSAHWGMK